MTRPVATHPTIPNNVPYATEDTSFVISTIAERSPRLYITKPTLVYVGAPSPTGWILVAPSTPIDDDFHPPDPGIKAGIEP